MARKAKTVQPEYTLTLVYQERDTRVTGRQAAERWVQDNWNGQREIESWTDNRFSLVYGVSVYELRTEGDVLSICRHDKPSAE